MTVGIYNHKERKVRKEVPQSFLIYYLKSFAVLFAFFMLIVVQSYILLKQLRHFTKEIFLFFHNGLVTNNTDMVLINQFFYDVTQWY